MELVFLVLILAALIVGIFYIRTLLAPKEQKPDQSIVLLQNQLHALSQTLEAKLGQVASESKHTVSEVTRQSKHILRDMTEKLTRVDEAARQTLAMNEQIKKLQDTLTNPKQRGVLGEYYLETVLKNVLPPGRYQMQYPFKNGVIVDAVVLTDKRVIPID